MYLFISKKIFFIFILSFEKKENLFLQKEEENNKNDFDKNVAKVISCEELVNRLSARIYKMFENGNTLPARKLKIIYLCESRVPIEKKKKN